MIVINAETMRSILDLDTQLDLIEQAMRITQDKSAHSNPLRNIVPLPSSDGQHNFMGLMPASMTASNSFGIKIVNIFHDNTAKGLSSHMGVMPLFDLETGAIKALIDASNLTAIRTAAASALATKTLSNPNSQILGIIGTGEQAESHIEAICHVRPIGEIVIAGSSHEKAVHFANKMAMKFGIDCIPAVDGQGVAALADIICTVTSSKSPVLRSTWLKPGQHINAVGACNAEQMELGPNCITVGKYYTDYMESLKAEAGEYVTFKRLNPDAEGDLATEIGAVICGQAAGRTDSQDITFYRSLGIGLQDLVFANHLYETALSKGLGQEVDI